MKTKYDKLVRNFEIGLFIMAIINITWAIVKSYLLNWKILTISMPTLGIYAMLFAGIYLLNFTLKDFIHYKKHGIIQHGMDERTGKVVGNSLRNAGTAAIIILYCVILYYSLFYQRNIILFSLNTLSWILAPVGVIFFISFCHYDGKKGL